MNLATKYNLKDTLFYLNDAGTICKSTVALVSVTASIYTKQQVTVSYKLQAWGKQLLESDLFDTKEAVAEHWLTSHGLKTGVR